MSIVPLSVVGMGNTSTNHFGIWLRSWALGQATTEPMWVHEFRGVVIPRRHCFLWCFQIYGFTIFCPSSAIVSEPWEGAGHIDILFVAEYSTDTHSINQLILIVSFSFKQSCLSLLVYHFIPIYLLYLNITSWFSFFFLSPTPSVYLYLLSSSDSWPLACFLLIVVMWCIYKIYIYILLSM